MIDFKKTLIIWIILNLLLFLNLFLKEVNKKENPVNNDNNEIFPSVIFYNNDSVDVSFYKPNLKKLFHSNNEEEFDYIYPETNNYRIQKENIKKCLKVMKKNKKPPNKENLNLIKNIPGYVPLFGEYQNYDYSKIDWERDFKDNYNTMNPFKTLGFYDQKIEKDMYDDDPNIEVNFDNAHMGIFNDKNYCNNHDIFLLHNYNNDKNYIKKVNYVSDYHQLSLIRLFVLKNYGDDMMPEMSKNMDRVNFFQKLYPIDLRTTAFITKKSGWHFYHEIGNNFNCFGQVYNHIPGHGNLIRKDSLTMASNEYINKFGNNKKCKNESNVFPSGYRLYELEECKEFFKIINSKKYFEDIKKIPIQFVIKLGIGVHRGEGVFIFDQEKEKEIREQYQNGKKCGEIELNQIAQEYIYDPLLIDNHKFDFRVYMLIASVNPLIILYHDGFLRVSISEYNLKSNKRNVHLTNTEIFKAILKDIREKNHLYNGMNEEKLREFQMRTMDQFYDNLIKNKLIKNVEEGKIKIKKQMKKAFLHLGKMVENNLLKTSNNFELFGVDFILDKDFNVFVLEVNASPMLIGTADRKTKLMKGLTKGMFDIVFKLNEKRTKNGLDFVIKNKEKILKLENIEDLKKEFMNLMKNNGSDIDDIVKNSPWELCYDGSKKNYKEKYMDLVSDECIDIIEKFN